MAVLYYLISAGGILLARYIGKKWHFGHLIGGLIFGVYNEICFEFCWTYSDKFGFMVWRDVPLIIIIGWGVYTGIALGLSERILAWVGTDNRWMRKGLDVLLFVAIGFPMETLMAKTGYWHYNFAIQGILWMQLFGYVFVGVLVSSAGRSFQALIDNQ